jgi:hypothetical protein
MLGCFYLKKTHNARLLGERTWEICPAPRFPTQAYLLDFFLVLIAAELFMLNKT